MIRNLLLDFIKRHIITYIAGILLLIIYVIVSMEVPSILGEITDSLGTHPLNRRHIFFRVFLMMSMVLIAFGLKFSWRWFLNGNSRGIELCLRGNLFRHLERLPLSFYSEHKTGDLVALAINDVQAIRMAFGPGFMQALDGIVSGLFSIFFMSHRINERLAFFAILPMPFAVLLMIKLAPVIQKRFRKVQENYAAIADRVQENISGIRIIKAFAQEADELNRFIELSKERMNAQMRLVRISALLTPGIQISFGISYVFFIIYGSRFIQKGMISSGDFVAFNLYLLALMAPVTTIGRIIEIIQKGSASYHRLEEIFDIDGEKTLCLSIPATDGDDVKNIELRGSVEFRNVCFRYPGARRNALTDISFKVENGQTLGIIGATGSGKTTIVNLILRLYDVDSGEILIDGINIDDIPLDVLRENIGYVPQDNFLFSTTIRNNIEFFCHDYKIEEIEEAARLSQIYDGIVSFPDGFDTVIGERGVTLSGGQKQRISIARALIKDPVILILDDSFSAVDSKTEMGILKNIRTILENRSGIIISHRLSTIEKADKVILLDDGRIIAQGTHEDLLTQSGIYSLLWKFKSGTYDVE